MGYYIDLSAISIDDYKLILKEMDLLPSWKILEDDVDENLDIIKEHQIDNLEQLVNTIKNKQKIHDFAEITGLSVDYLTVLSRVIRGYLPKPTRIRDFPGLDSELSDMLGSKGIKNTLHLYPHILTPDDRETLSLRTNIPIDQIIVLAQLCDLSRIKWVSHTFAIMLLESGYHSAFDIAHSDHKDLYNRVKMLNDEKRYYKGTIGLNDMQRVIDAAKGLDFELVLNNESS